MNDNWQQKAENFKKTATLSAENPTCTAQGLNLGLNGEKTVTVPLLQVTESSIRQTVQFQA